MLFTDSGMVYEIFGKKISGPFTIPAGIVTTEPSVLERIANEVPQVGILTSKSVGPQPRAGYREPVIAQYSYYSFINAVGLANPGKDEYAKKISKVKIPKDKFLLISIFGGDGGEFRDVAETLYPYADGFELNISCPHSGVYGQSVGKDVSLVKRVVKEVTSLGKPVMVKLSPNLDVVETAKASLKGGASGFTLINTRGPEEFLYEGFPVLSNKVGGVSGREILGLGLKSVRKVRRLTSLPIIACGGISNADHVKLYRRAGADFFGVGSALAGMSTKLIKDYFRYLSYDVENSSNRSLRYVRYKVNMDYRKFKVSSNERLADDLYILSLDNGLPSLPGQFVFAWLPGKSEKPFSVFGNDPLTLLVQKRGCFTSHLSELERDDFLYVRGPYGNSPSVDEHTLFVGGGTGIAALYLFMRRYGGIALFGAKDKDHIPYADKLNRIFSDIYITTESGDFGSKGLVTDNLEEIIDKYNPEFFVNCGPEAMVSAAVKKELNYAPPENVYSSLEFLTMCGVGLCGRCATSKGYRNCVDGTFFNPHQFSKG
jgi:dihydroorotate dehydrogenase subfamily 1